MTALQRESIAQHGRNLLAIFPNATERDPVALCKKLRALEARGAALALRLCNGPEFPNEDDADKISDAILAKVNALLGSVEHDGSPCVFLNRDPRGYALKIVPSFVRAFNLKIHTDWGGYGIIAPEISEHGH